MTHPLPPYAQLWDVDAGMCTASLTCDATDAPLCMAATAAGVVTGHTSGGLCLWDWRQPSAFTRPVQHIPGVHAQSPVTGLDACGARPHTVLSCGADSSLYLTDLRMAPHPLQRFKADAFRIPQGAPARGALSPDGAMVCAGSSDGALWLWSVRSETATTLRGHLAACVTATWGSWPAGGLVASTDAGGVTMVWSPEGAQMVGSSSGAERG